jgi:hypothetical protein
MNQEMVLTGKFGFRQWLSSQRRDWSLSISAFLALAFIIFAPTSGFAQSAIAGVVTDASNAVLPGVTVEAFQSCAYRKGAHRHDRRKRAVPDRRPRPGLYNVTFTLAGFKNVVREGCSCRRPLPRRSTRR